MIVTRAIVLLLCSWIAGDLGAQTVGFIENRGQWREDIVAYCPGEAVRVTQGGLEFLRGDVAALRWSPDSEAAFSLGEPLPGVVHRLVGDPADWQRGLTHHAALTVDGLWEGARLQVRAGSTGVELTLDAESWDQAAASRFWPIMRSDATGSIPLRLRVDGESRPALLEPAGDGGHRVVRADEVDSPWITVLGGTSGEHPRHVAMGSEGETFVGVETYSADFPVSEDAFDQTFDEGQEAAVLCYGPGGELIFATYLGGSEGGENVDDLSAHPDGGVVVFGLTGSDDFPITPGVLDDHIEHLYTKKFASHLNADGTDLEWSTFLLTGQALAVGGVVHANGEVTVAGQTEDPGFPTSPGAYKSADDWDDAVTQGFVMRLTADATSLVYSTLFGGALSGSVTNLAADESGRVALEGRAHPEGFPVTKGALDETPDEGPNSSQYIAVMSDYGTQLHWASYFEFGHTPPLRDIAFGPLGRVYLVGYGSEPDVPVTPQAFDTSPLALVKGFVSCIDADGTDLVYSTFFGGSWWCEIWDIDVDGSGVASITGSTRSLDHPVTPGAFQTEKFQEKPEVYLARFAPDGRSLLYSTFLDGSSTADQTAALDLGDEGVASVAFEGDPDTVVPTDGSTFSGHDDIVVAHLDPLPTGVVRQGQPTLGDHLPLAIGVRDMPAVGAGGFALTCSQAPALSSRGWLLLGAPLAEPVTVLGAELWVDPAQLTALVPVTSDEVGWVDLRLPLPDDPSLAGLVAAAQFAWLDASARGGLAASSALRITVQP